MVSRIRRDDPLEVIQQLIEIGPRPATSLGEARAAAFVGGWLRRAGLRVGTDTFRAAIGLGITYFALALLGLVALLLALWQPLAGLLAATLGLLFAVSDALTAPLPPMTFYRDSQNIVATRAPQNAQDPTAAPSRWRVVVLAPLDTPTNNHWLRNFTGRSPLALAGRIMAFALLILLNGLLFFEQRELWLYLQLTPLVYLLLTSLLLPSANSSRMFYGSAGALTAMLGVVEELDQLENTELWAVALGATSTGHEAVQDMLMRYPFPPAETLFLSLPLLEPGALMVATHEGLLGQHRADAPLLKLATERAALQQSINLQRRPYQDTSSPTALLLSRGYRALTLCTEPRSAHPALSEADRTDRTQLVQLPLAQAIQLLVEMIQYIDQTDEDLCPEPSSPEPISVEQSASIEQQTAAGQTEER